MELTYNWSNIFVILILNWPCQKRLEKFLNNFKFFVFTIQTCLNESIIMKNLVKIIQRAIDILKMIIVNSQINRFNKNIFYFWENICFAYLLKCKLNTM